MLPDIKKKTTTPDINVAGNLEYVEFEHFYYHCVPVFSPQILYV